MHKQYNLSSWMRDQELPDLSTSLLDPLSPDLSLLNQISLGNRQTPSLLNQMSSLQGLPLSQTQESIKTYSSNATPLSRDIKRGRSPRHRFMLKSSPNSPRPSATIEQDQMQLLGCSLRLSKAMIQRLEQR